MPHREVYHSEDAVQDEYGATSSSKHTMPSVVAPHQVSRHTHVQHRHKCVQHSHYEHIHTGAGETDSGEMEMGMEMGVDMLLMKLMKTESSNDWCSLQMKL